MNLSSLRNGVFLAIGVLSVGTLFFMFSVKYTEHRVELRSDGFHPQKLTIQKGDTVYFTTSLEQSFWPASNLHPTHTVYTEFDPREPIDQKQSWSFQFKKSGQWKYHDHLSPLFTGLITVLDVGEEKSSKQAAANCKNLKEKQEQCWQDLVELTLQEEGVGAAFGVVESLYETSPNCHGYVHLIGEEAYQLFSKGKEMVLTPKTYYCGYGFYHGFMESLLQESSDIAQARTFCTYADNQLSLQIGGTEDACYHGIGHGAVDGGDPRYWGDIEAMIQPAMDICELLGDVESHRYLCLTGVFNAIEILSEDPQYKLNIVKENPFWLCDRQPEHYREACYTNMIPALLRIYGYDLARIAQYIEYNITEKDNAYDIRSIVIMSLSHEHLNINAQRPDKGLTGVALCRGLKERSHLPCIEGLAGGFMKYGKPGKEDVEGLAFCKSKMLFEEEREACFRHILLRLTFWNSPARARQICSTVDQKFQNYCSHY